MKIKIASIATRAAEEGIIPRGHAPHAPQIPHTPQYRPNMGKKDGFSMDSPP